MMQQTWALSVKYTCQVISSLLHEATLSGWGTNGRTHWLVVSDAGLLDNKHSKGQ
jgi:hypothetical protein